MSISPKCSRSSIMDISDVTSKIGIPARPGNQGHRIADFTCCLIGFSAKCKPDTEREVPMASGMRVVQDLSSAHFLTPAHRVRCPVHTKCHQKDGDPAGLASDLPGYLGRFRVFPSYSTRLYCRSLRGVCLTARAPRRGRRTTLTFPVFPPPQKN